METNPLESFSSVSDPGSRAEPQQVFASWSNLHINGCRGRFMPELRSSWRRVQWRTGGPRVHKGVSERKNAAERKDGRELETSTGQGGDRGPNTAGSVRYSDFVLQDTTDRILQGCTGSYSVVQDTTGHSRVLQDTARYYKMLQDTTGILQTGSYSVVPILTFSWILHDTTGYYRMLQDTAGYFRLLNKIN